LKTRVRTPHAGRTTAPSEPQVTVGWMGVTLTAPEGWSPVSVSGEGSEGYLKVASPDTRYVEVKWNQPKGTLSVPTALEGYFDKLRKAAKRSRQELKLKLKPRGLSAVRPQKQAPIPYSWEADKKALGCIWHCGECNRMVIAEVVGELDDDLSIAAEMLRGLRDHGETLTEDDATTRWNTWALYGLTVPAPESYTVEKQVLMTGHQRFRLRERGSSLQADRWGLAEIALRGATLRQWYESRESGWLSRYAYQVEETELHGHPALRFSGRDRVPFAALKLLKAAQTMTWPRFFLHGYVWHCTESNRIYAVMGEQPRRSGLLETVVGRMRCHD
jgi:hypothetical protein